MSFSSPEDYFDQAAASTGIDAHDLEIVANLFDLSPRQAKAALDSWTAKKRGKKMETLSKRIQVLKEAVTEERLLTGEERADLVKKATKHIKNRIAKGFDEPTLNELRNVIEQEEDGLTADQALDIANAAIRAWRSYTASVLSERINKLSESVHAKDDVCKVCKDDPAKRNYCVACSKEEKALGAKPTITAHGKTWKFLKTVPAKEVGKYSLPDYVAIHKGDSSDVYTQAEYAHKEMREIEPHEDKVVDAVSSIPDFEMALDDGRPGHDVADDGNIHINHGKYRFVFYKGQGKGELTEKDIPKYRRLVDQAVKRVKSESLGEETPGELEELPMLENDMELKDRIEALRTACGLQTPLKAEQAAGKMMPQDRAPNGTPFGSGRG